mmetsp:Transcript_34994/g.71295  ORF Transcript_34994/g.71295 Transcript_34994/m.71295 type:complete len:82 (+) Transcript_34994:150-395(+)
MTTQQALPAIDRRSIVLGRAESHESQSHQGLMTLRGWLELLDSSGSIQHFLDSAQRAPNEKGHAASDAKAEETATHQNSCA